MQDQNVACRWTCALPSRNLASTHSDGKCHVDAHEIHTCLYGPFLLKLLVTVKIMYKKKSFKCAINVVKAVQVNISAYMKLQSMN